MKTVKFFTLGCKVNQYDTQSIRERFLKNGFKELSGGKPADNYVVNTCTVTSRADTDSLGLVRRALKENPKARVIVTGCLTKLDRNKIMSACPGVYIIRNKDKDLASFLSLRLSHKNLSSLRGARRATKQSQIEIASPPKIVADRNDGWQAADQSITFFKGHTRAFLKIQDGCDNFCSYCKVPFVRGKPRSKGLPEIIQEARGLAENGFKEIVLCGICLGAYASRDGRGNLVSVIEELEKIPGISRIRLSSIEPDYVSEALIEKLSASKKLCRHLHIPLQSADKKILKSMNRKYTPEYFFKLVCSIKKKIPGVAITTDVLVGYPCETEVSFSRTFKALKKIMPLKTHIFPYSRREGTLAAKKFPKQLEAGTIKKRAACLSEEASACSLIFRRKFLGKVMPVLMEARVKNLPDFWEGHTDNYLKVRARSKQNLKNRLINVCLKKINGEYFIGILVRRVLPRGRPSSNFPRGIPRVTRRTIV